MKLNERLKRNVQLLEGIYREPKSLEWNKNFIFNSRLQPSFILIRGITNFYNSEVYRSRSLGKDEDISNINTFKYPPIRYNSLGRTNLKSKQVFYGSNCPTTSLLEYLNTGNASKEVYLSVWRFKKRRNIQTFEISQFDEGLDYLKWKLHKKSNNETLDLMKDVFEYLIKLYKSPDYSFSAPFSHFLLYTHNICEMIKYPSVVTDSQSNNYAINIDFFDHEFELSKVYKVEVFGKTNMSEYTDINDLKVLMKPREIGQVTNNEIIYTPFLEKEDSFWNSYIELRT